MDALGTGHLGVARLYWPAVASHTMGWRDPNCRRDVGGDSEPSDLAGVFGAGRPWPTVQHGARHVYQRLHCDDDPPVFDSKLHVALHLVIEPSAGFAACQPDSWPRGMCPVP